MSSLGEAMTTSPTGHRCHINASVELGLVRRIVRCLTWVECINLSQYDLRGLHDKCEAIRRKSSADAAGRVMTFMIHSSTRNARYVHLPGALPPPVPVCHPDALGE